MKYLMLSLLFIGLGFSSVNAKPANPLMSIPMSDAAGLLTNGKFEVKHFIGKQGQVWAVGKLTGVVGGKQITHGLQLPVTLSEGSASIVPAPVSNQKSILPVKNQNAKPMQCNVLNMAFGPTDITVLGL